MGEVNLTVVSVKTWITWTAALLVMGVTVTVFAFTNFRTESKAVAHEFALQKRLDKIESKVDDIYEILIKRGK